MSVDSTVSISLIVAVGGFIFAVYNWYAARKNETIEQRDEQGRIKEDFIKVNLKLDSICQNMTELRTDTKSISKDLKEMDKRVTILERDQKTIWDNIDEIRRKSNE